MKNRFFCVLFSWLALTASVRLAAAESTPLHGRPFVVGEQIEAEDFDLGGESVAYHGEGAIVTVIRQTWWGSITNVWPSLPRDRPDADITVGGPFLGLRAKEWVQFSVAVETNGYYSFDVKNLGYPKKAPDCEVIGGPATGPFELWVDGTRVGVGTTVGVPSLYSEGRIAGSTIGRVWLAEGQHKLRLVGLWAPTYLWQCDMEHPWTLWTSRTCAIDWLRVVPACAPVRPTGPGIRTDPSATLLTRLPNGGVAFWVHGLGFLQWVTAGGEVGILAGFPGNPVREGKGTNAGFASIRQCMAAGDSDLFVLQNEGGTNSIVSRVIPDGTVTTAFHGQVVIPSVMKRFPAGWFSYTNLPANIDRLVLMTNGIVEAHAYCEQEEPRNSGLIVYRRGFARFRLLSNGGFEHFETDWNGFGLPEIDSGVIEGGYRLDAGVLSRVLDGFAHPVLELKQHPIKSALAASEGELWAASLDGWIYRLVPEPNGSYLKIDYPSDGRIEVTGIPEWAVAPDEEVRLEVKSKQGFWTLASWSDGVTDNPRTITISKDTMLVANLEQRLPNERGIAPKTVSVAANGRLRFALIGPPAGGTAYPYRIEVSGNLKSWQTVPSVTVLGVSGQSSVVSLK